MCDGNFDIAFVTYPTAMAFSTYYTFVDFFPLIDKTEVQKLIILIDGEANFKDIFLLSRGDPARLASLLDDTPDLFGAFVTSFAAKALEVAADIRPVDPKAPTAEESLRLLSGFQLFYNFWPDAKRGALEWALQTVASHENVEGTYGILQVAGKLTPGSAAFLSQPELYVGLARYYIVMAGRYIARELKHYTVTGRVVASGNVPMEGVQVRLQDKNVVVARQSGATFTNDKGYFRSSFSTMEDISSKYTLEVAFTHPQLKSAEIRSISYDVAYPKEIHSFTLSFDPVPSSSKTVASTGTAIPADVQTYLTGHGITVSRLEDIRRLGGFINLPSDGIDKDNPALLKLDGLASLELVNPDVPKNSTLYARGYTSISRIANTPRKDFVAQNKDELGDFGSAQVHYRARAAHLYALNALAGELTQRPAGETPSTAPVGPANGCGCSDCASTVSPLAYLADLLCFTLDNLDTASGTSITLNYIKTNFFQEIGALPASCSSLNTTMCQNRIAAEVLRQYYATAEISTTRTPRQLSDFATAQHDYLTGTYELLLNKLGTSYLEIRRMRGVQDVGERKRLSERLGIVLDVDTNPATPDTIKQLFIDLSNPANPAETALQSLFGHRRTTPFMLDPNPESNVAQWKKARLREMWREQDRPRNAYWDHGKVIVDPDVVIVDDLRQLDPLSARPVFDLWAKRRAWVDLAYTTLNGRTLPGNTTDAFHGARMIVAYGRNYIAPGPTPTITYSTSTPVAYSQTFDVVEQLYVNGNTYYKVLQEVPQDMVNGTIAIGGATPPTHSNAGLPVRSATEMIERLRGDHIPPYSGNVIPSGWPESSPAELIDTLRLSRTQVMQGDASGLIRISQRGFTLASAGRLVDLYDKHRQAPLDRLSQGNLSEAEWQEFINILIAVLKGRASDSGAVWRTEEANMQLGPDAFWPAIVEPRPGLWPLDRLAAPLLDPDLVSANAVPEVTARTYIPALVPDTSLDILADRRAELAAADTLIRAAHDTSFAELLETAFDSPDLVWDAALPANNDYLRLLNQLTDPLWEDWARLVITERLHISPEDLRILVITGTKEHDGVAVPTSDLEQLYGFLLDAHKRIKKYAPWQSVEAGIPDWKLRKAQLPKWRASLEERLAWTAALAENSAPPTIDADLLGPGDLRNPVAADRAFTLWKQRWVEMHGPYNGYPNDGNAGWLHSVNTAALTSTNALDTLTKTHLGHAESSLAYIREQQEDGIDIRPRLAQLQLTATEFAQLLALRDILPVPPQTPADLLTGEEKITIKRILAQVKKRRKAFAYRFEEVGGADPDEVVTLSPDFFRLPEVQVVVFPPTPEHPLTPWLTTERDLIAWRRTLSGRIEQEASMIKAWEEVLHEVDEAMMVHLRDALVQLCGLPDRTLLQNARAIGDKLLIDLENNCCYKTNRVAAAIETLQQLLWKTRTGDILADYPAMECRGEDFDEAWTWMGSYANWRAAMFVFLYPENVLIPSLRKQQTPAFQAVVEATRSNRRFGPDDACQVARDYRDYLVDVADLELKCSAEAEVFIRKTGCGVQSTDKPRLLFTFAQGRSTQNAYYCTVDARDKTDILQNSYWQRIPALDETARIFGCTVFFPEGVEEFIYLFFTRTGRENEAKFFALRFNLLNGLWEEEPLEFEVEQDDLRISAHNPISAYSGFKKEDFSPNIKAIALRHNTYPRAQPTIAVSLEKTGGVSKDVYTFYWPMADGGKEFKPRWDGDGWRLDISGDRVLKGHVRFFVGMWVEENAKELDHSLFVLRSGTTMATNPTWTTWNTRYQLLIDVRGAFDQYSILFHFTVNGEEFYRVTIGSVIQAHIAQQPPQTIPVEHSAADYLAYVQIYGGPDYADTIYTPPAYSLNVAKEIRFLLPFHDRSTFHLEIDQNGDRRQDVVAYSSVNPNIPIVTNSGTLPASVFPEGRNLVAPVRDQRFFDPGNPDFEAQGGLLLHQESGNGTRIGLSWHGKAFNQTTPLNSTMQVTSVATVLTPGLSSVPVIQSEFTAAELDMRRSTSQYDLEQNTDPNFRLTEYVHEAYYFVPMQIALQLAANGYHQAALDWFRTIYDTSRPLEGRKIYYGLVQDAQGTVPGPRASDWYSDPLNPHAIAAMRPFTYTRYTILAIAQCALSYADAQFTIDNSETVPRARELYEDAIALLEMLVPPDPCPYDAAVDEFDQEVELGTWTSTFHDTFRELEPLSRQPGFGDLVGDISDVLAGSTPMEVRLADVRDLIGTAQAGATVRTFAQTMTDGRADVDAYAAAALGSLGADTTVVALGGTSARTFGRAVRDVTGLQDTALATASLPWLMNDAAPLATSRANEVDRVNVGRTGTLIDHYDQRPSSGFGLNSPYPNICFSGLPFTFCSVPNPIVKALLMTAEVQLWKIHNCMNIAGLVRELDPFAAATDSTTGIPVIGMGGTLSIPSDRQLPPSAYRYRAIMDRARQLVGMAQQVESAFLATLEKLDAERYSLLRAEQDIESTKAQMKLQDLRMTEANDGVRLAQLQRDRAQLQMDGLQGMIDAGLLGAEQELFATYLAAGFMQQMMLMDRMMLESVRMAMTIASAGGGVTAPASVAATSAAAVAGFMANSMLASHESALININTSSQILSLLASFERRKQEWEFQKSLATQDVKIADQGIKLAQDRVNITGQERAIAALQNDHARATLDFLKNKFTSAELYEWMSGVLEDVYAYFLQAATSMALLAQRQLAFERQLDLPPFIRTDYWMVDAGSMGGVSLTGEGAVDRRGLTGSTRLLQDLTELDQYAFSTNTPKLQMSKTISLNETAPEELIRLRDQGVMTFRTTQEMFDRDYPGHYLRLVKQVSVTVIALNPPNKGIRATLTNGGVSRVVTGGAIFQERVINRLPEQIALSSGVSDRGVFQLRGEGEFLDPFEGTGVDTQWEFRMEKAANPFDFGSIADVLLTIEYEALNSFTYRQTVVQRLNTEPATGGLAISFKNNLPDQWFDLHNPDQAAARFAATFEINERDLQPNIQVPHTIDHVAVYFVMKDGEQYDQRVTLGYGPGPGYEARPNDNLISTRSNAQGFVGLHGLAGPTGTWSFALEDSLRTRLLMTGDQVDDILLVITYSGAPPLYSA